MGKTIYIQIDNNSLPDGCSEDVEMIDCRCINDFCSLIGDRLVGDLKDENGKPFYRLINPVGKLLMDFKDVDEKAFNSIIEDWFDILGNLLHKGMQEDDIVIKFPQQYVDWLLHNDNPYYEQVGKELQRQNGKITLSTEAIDDDIIASLKYKVSHLLQEKKEDFSFVVFSNPIIRNSSFVVKRVRLDGIEFMRYDSWMEHLAIRKLEEETAKQKSFNINGVTFEMIRVEGGTFTMGASNQDSDAFDSERPAHKVTLSTFYIGKYEVTQELWQAVMGNNPSHFKGSQRPVEQVSWDDCQKFIRQLNQLTGQCFRLPTEAEWEYAARGGMSSKGFEYAGSNNLGSVAWYRKIGGSETHPVGLKQPNELGLYDMSGNVWEWCQDWYDRYGSNAQTNPTGAISGANRVCRGGCWYNSEEYCRSSCRNCNIPTSRDDDLGFRLAL